MDKILKQIKQLEERIELEYEQLMFVSDNSEFLYEMNYSNDRESLYKFIEINRELLERLYHNYEYDLVELEMFIDLPKLGNMIYNTYFGYNLKTTEFENEIKDLKLEYLFQSELKKNNGELNG